MADMMTDSENGTVEIAGDVSGAVGEVKKRRGRPPGSKNQPREAKDGTLSVGLENAILGLFELMALVGHWFGYERTDDLTAEEAKQGAKAFTPIATKLPWFANIAMWIGAPVWLIMTARKKFARKVAKDDNASENANSTASRGNALSAMEGTERAEAANGQGETVGYFPPRG